MKKNETTSIEKKKTDLEIAELKGPVKQVMQIRYKAYRRSDEVIAGKIEVDSNVDEKNMLTTYDKNGGRIKEEEYGSYFNDTNFFNEQYLVKEKWQDLKTGVPYSKTYYTYDKSGRLIEHLTIYAEGNQFKHTHTYNEEGKKTEDATYIGKEELLKEKTVYSYNEHGHLRSIVRTDADGKINYHVDRKFNEQGKIIEDLTEYLDKSSSDFNRRTVHQYNSHNDCVQTDVYDLKGNLKNSYTYHYEYDREGKKILPPAPQPYDPKKKTSNETEQLEFDAYGNWIKKTTFHNKIPVNIFVREITYFGEPEKKLIHPLSQQQTEVEDNTYKPDELKKKDAKWLVESPNAAADNFSVLRYYALQFNEAPSVIAYTLSNIEVVALRDELIKNMHAQEIHSYATIRNGRYETMMRFTLTFPLQYGYMLHVPAINEHDEAEFEVPDFMENRDAVYTGLVQLLRPSSASGRRDDFFENDLSEYLSKCILIKKPDQPVINIIEVSGDSFVMSEHAVNNNFEIRDLNVNYGAGFEQFHNDLMHRFNSSTRGLVLFHGAPGTGKTYYIRHLLRKMVSQNKVVIYMPPNMVDHLVEPGFMTFLTSEVQNWSAEGNFCVLLIEDAEPLLAKRQEGVRIQGITNLLNMSDGILNDLLNLQIICTFNVDLSRLDSALLRPGRLIARKEFKALSELDANLLAQRLGINHHFTKPATLGEIYALKKDQHILIHDVEPDRDASDLIDDLMS